jgi:hypothetical protein
MKASGHGRWWTIGGVLPDWIAHVRLELGDEVISLEPQGRLLAAAVPAGPPDQIARLVIVGTDGGTHKGPPMRMLATGGSH